MSSNRRAGAQPLLFVAVDGATGKPRPLTKSKKSRIHQHVQCYDNDVSKVAPQAVVMISRQVRKSAPHHHRTQELRIAKSPTLSVFDPFDSLASGNGHDTGFLVHVLHPQYEHAPDDDSRLEVRAMWDLAMGNTAYYHSLAAFLLTRTSGNSIDQPYRPSVKHRWHRGLALKAMRDSLEDSHHSSANTALLPSVALHLDFAVEEENFPEATIHNQALAKLSSIVNIADLNYGIWEVALALAIRYANMTCTVPAMAYVQHPECSLRRCEEYFAMAEREVHRLLPKLPRPHSRSVDVPALFSLFRRAFLRKYVLHDRRAYVGVATSLKYDTAVHKATILNSLTSKNSSSAEDAALYSILLILELTAWAWRHPTPSKDAPPRSKGHAETMLNRDLHWSLMQYSAEDLIAYWRDVASVECLVWILSMACYYTAGEAERAARGIFIQHLDQALEELKLTDVKRLRHLLEEFPACPGWSEEQVEVVWWMLGRG